MKFKSFPRNLVSLKFGFEIFNLEIQIIHQILRLATLYRTLPIHILISGIRNHRNHYQTKHIHTHINLKHLKNNCVIFIFEKIRRID